MHRVATVVVGALAIALAASTTVHAAVYYVTPSGAATWSACTNIGTPCAPATAMANSQAGDTVYFRGGTYTVGESWGNTPSYGDLMPKNSGTASQPITFRNYPGEVPVIDGTVTAGRDDTICLGAVNVSFIVWDGFGCQAMGGLKMANVYFYRYRLDVCFAIRESTEAQRSSRAPTTDRVFASITA